MPYMYANRMDAGEKLSQNLSKYKNCNGIVLALPRGGVPVAKVIAKQLNLPLEVLLVKKLGHPLNSEYAIGSVTLNSVFIDDHHEISQQYIDAETSRIRAILQERRKKYMGDKLPTPLTGKTVVLVDDGVATGSTLIASIGYVKSQGATKVVVAVPVSPPSSAQKIRKLVDEFICPLEPYDFYGVGQFYQDFSEVTDDEVVQLLKEEQTVS